MFKKFFLTCLLPLLLLASFTYGACPITQSALTKMFWEHFPKYTNAQKKEFLLGTFFPDVYYLAECPKEITHFDNVTLHDILNAPSAFQAGLLFHSFVEQERENYVIQNGAYEHILPYNSPRISTQLKIAEDELLYGTANWKICSTAVSTILEDEKTFSIKPEAIQQWHLALSYYFSYAPSWVLWYLSAQEIGAFDVTPDEMAAVYEIHKGLIKDPFIENHVEGLMDHFRNQFSQTQEEK